MPGFVLNYTAPNILESMVYIVILTLLLVAVPLFASQFVHGLWGVAEDTIMRGAFNIVAATTILAPVAGMKESIGNVTKYALSKGASGIVKTGENFLKNNFNGKFSPPSSYYNMKSKIKKMAHVAKHGQKPKYFV